MSSKENTSQPTFNSMQHEFFLKPILRDSDSSFQPITGQDDVYDVTLVPNKPSPEDLARITDLRATFHPPPQPPPFIVNGQDWTDRISAKSFSYSKFECQLLLSLSIHVKVSMKVIEDIIDPVDYTHPLNIRRHFYGLEPYLRREEPELYTSVKDGSKLLKEWGKYVFREWMKGPNGDRVTGYVSEEQCKEVLIRMSEELDLPL